MPFQMTAVIRADVAHQSESCERFDQPAYVAYLLTFNDPNDALGPARWHRLSKVGPNA